MSMSNTELLMKEVETLPPNCVQEIIDFAGYLRQKYAQGQEDIGIDGECPGPEVRLDHTPNAETIAAMQEVRDMASGKIPRGVSFDPTKYNSREELKAALTEVLGS
jgi:hypothetical protein